MTTKTRIAITSNLLERVVNALDAVLLHVQQEAARQLWPRRPRVEQRWRRVREEPLRHEVVRLHSPRDVPLVDTDRNAHEHVLDALDHHAFNPAGGGQSWIHIEARLQVLVSTSYQLSSEASFQVNTYVCVTVSLFCLYCMTIYTPNRTIFPPTICL